MTNGVEAAPAAEDSGKERTAVRPGHIPGEGSMWFFIIGDLLIFGVYFVAYAYYRGENQELFLQSQQQLNQGIGVVNTVILLTSSLFVALGTQAAREGKSSDASRLISIAFAIGSIFPLMKLLEWVPKISAGITPGENLFFMYYYIMTGLHLCHVLLGLVILCFVIQKLRTSRNPDVEFVETGAVYWHMVDLLWIIVFALFYLMR